MATTIQDRDNEMTNRKYNIKTKFILAHYIRYIKKNIEHRFRRFSVVPYDVAYHIQWNKGLYI